MITEEQPAAPANQVLVTAEELQGYIEQIRAYKKMRADLEFDIGWVIESIANLDTSKIMKMLPRIVMGKIDVKEIGLDVDRLKAIGEKYAPQTAARLKAGAETK